MSVFSSRIHQCLSSLACILDPWRYIEAWEISDQYYPPWNSEDILEIKDPKEIMENVFETAFSTGLFERKNIKVRLNPYKFSLVDGSDQDFIHVFANIMEGRTDQQKANLSKKIVSQLIHMFPGVELISINIRDFEKASYINKTMF